MKYMKNIEMINASHNKFASQAYAGLHPNFIKPEVMPELIEINASDNAIPSFNCNGYKGMILDLRNNKITSFTGGAGGFQALGYYLDGRYNTLSKTSSVNFSTLGNVVPQRLSCNSNIKSKFSIVTPKLSASADWDQVKLTVGASSGDASYKLERKTGSGAYKTIKTWESGELYNPEFGENEYLDTNVTAGTDYTYRLTTTLVIQDGNKKPTPWSKSIEKKIRTAPASPSITVKSPKRGTVSISWKAVPGATGYDVYYGKNGSKSATTRLTSTSKLSYTRKMTAGKTFYFRVRAFKTIDGKKYYGNPCSVKGVRILK